MRRFYLVSVTAAAATLVLLAAMAPPASAGGSWLYPAEDEYSPGDQAVLQGDFGHGQLGWLEDGPFFAFLRVDPDAVEASAPDAWPYIHASDVPLGEIMFESGGINLIATVSFIVPELPPGSYEVTYCNDPCTNGIGDLIGGAISVGQSTDQTTIEHEADDDAISASTSATTINDSAEPPAPVNAAGDADGDSLPNWLLVGLLATIGLAAAITVLTQRGLLRGDVVGDNDLTVDPLRHR